MKSNLSKCSHRREILIVICQSISIVAGAKQAKIMFYLMFIYISVIWGSSFILMKRAELCYPAMTLASYRLLSAAAILLIFWFIGRREKPFELKDSGHIVVMSVCTIIPYAVQPYLIALYGSAFIGMMVIFVPLLTILISLPLLKKYPEKKEIIGVFGGLGFAWLIVRDGLSRDLNLLDIILAFSIPFFYALGNVYTKKKLNHLTPLNLSLAVMLISGIILLPFALTMESVNTADSSLFTTATVNLLILGILGTGIPIIFFFSLIKNRGPLFAGMVTYIIPIGAILWGMADGEKTTLVQIIAISGLIIMVAVVQWKRRSPSQKPA